MNKANIKVISMTFRLSYFYSLKDIKTRIMPLLLPFDGKTQHNDDKMQHNVYSVRGRVSHIQPHSACKLQHKHRTIGREGRNYET
jgi:hypothetical protein